MIRERVGYYQERLAASSATLVAVTKGVEAARIMEAIDAGVRHIGENKVQEALLKYESVSDYARSRQIRLTWHMIGHLQTNKVKEAVRLFDVIHSVDSVRLAGEIDRRAAAAGKIQDLMLEVNVSGESSKFGFTPEALKAAFPAVTALKNVRFKGLMTIAPAVSDPEEARPYFRRLKELCWAPCELSMGMTDDFQAALQEGATLVRIGRGIFGER